VQSLVLLQELSSYSKKNKVTYVKGHGKLIGPNQVEVDLLEGGKKQLNAKNILIATGSDVMPVPGITIDEKKIVSSTGALSLKEIPKHLVVIGGGVIGLELGSVWGRLGSKVTVVEFTDRIAAGADTEIATEFKKILEKQHMEFKLSHKVSSAKILPNGQVSLTVEPVGTGAGKPFSIEADSVLVSVGRRPYTDNLGLKEVGVKMSSRGQIEVNDHFVTNIPSIRAIGDCIRGPMLAHKAEDEGIAVIENILNPSAGHVNYNAIPSVIYTHPEVAWVGATEEELKAKQIKYRIGKFPFMANSRARTNDDTQGFVKILADEKTDQVYGIHIIAGVAGEMIAEAVLAIEYGASSEDIARTCHAHPTMMEAVKEAAMMVTGKAIHF